MIRESISMTGKINTRKIILALAIAITVCAILAGSAALATRVSAQGPVKAVIVELKGDPVVVARAKAKAAGQSFNEQAYRQQIIASQNLFLEKLTAAGVPYTVSSVTAPNGPVTATIEHRFNYVYNGLGLLVPEQILPIIAALEDVLNIHENEMVHLHLNRGIGYTGATRVYGTPPRLTRFDTLNTGGLEGDGVNIAIIDTGVDWTHEMFGGDPTPPQFGAAPSISLLGTNRKVIYYMNFTPAIAPDDFGHGTHVAGDAAGYRGFAPGLDGIPLTGDDVVVHGAAPQAKIMAYKVLTAVGSGLSTSIIAAIEDAVQPRTITGQPKPVAHVINLSLGGAGGPDSPNSVACDNAALAGAIVVASAGNSGPGEGTIGQPAAGRRVIAVGANLDPGSGPNSVDEIGGSRTRMPAFLLDGAAPITADIANNYVYCGLAETPDQVPDSVSGKIALIARGSSVTVDAAGVGTGLFSNKAAFAAAKGAIAAIIYNNVDGELTSATVRRSTIPVFGISKANGEHLLSQIGSTAAGAVSARHIRINKAQIFDPAMADFSSRGPVQGFGQVKPDVTAPGVSILSATVPVGGAQTNGGTMFDPTRYISTSGTSMSGPITAGVAALIKQKHPDWTPSMVRAALVNSATNLRSANGAPSAAGAQTINEQGGGLIDAFAAVKIKALMGVGQPAPDGQPQGRTFGLLAQGAAASPDFTPSYSFGVVPIANVVGVATLTQVVTIYDVAGGGGAGAYQLSVANVRGVDQSGFRVSFADAGGNAISSVTVPTNGSASFTVKTTVSGEAVSGDVLQAQWYVTADRADGGQMLRMPFYYRAERPVVTLPAANIDELTNAEVSGNPPIDADGSYVIHYSAAGPDAPAKFRIEEQRGGGAFEFVADVPAGRTSFLFDRKSNGLYGYRVAAMYPVQYGLLLGPYSASRAVQVDRRLESDVTSMIETALSNVAFAGGVFEFDQTVKNISADRTILLPLRFNITAIRSTSGTVRAANADNGGNGVESAALFDYSNTVGADRALAPGETSAARRLRFTNPASELFEFTAVVKGHFPDPLFSASFAGEPGESGRRRFKVRLHFIADPVTRSISLVAVE
jgi:subtilisin family serine protease